MSHHASVKAGGLYRASRCAHGIGALGLFLLGACSDSTDNLVAPGQPSPVRPHGALGVSINAIPGQYIITFRNDVSDVPGLAKRLAAENGAQLGFTYTSAIKGFSAKLPDQAIAALQRNPHVERIEADQAVRASDIQSSPGSWGLDRIDQRTLPLSASYTYGNSGAGVSAYILDTGIRTTHNEFGGRAFGAFTAINDGNGTNDCGGHGTHVAGTIGGAKYGVAKAVKLYSVRVLDCTGYGSYSGIVAGIDWVTRNRVLPAVANMSLGGGVSSTVNTAVQNSIAAGVVYAVSAGNDASDACSYSPASVPAAITAGAAASFDAMSLFSNFGSCVDVFGPGQSIRSASNVDDTTSVTKSGTSMASPHVAGVAALYLGANPSATPTQVAAAIMANATTGVLTGVPTNTSNRLLYSGFVGGASSPPPPPPPDTTSTGTKPPPTTTDQPPVASFTANCPHGKCTFDASASTDDKGIASYSWSYGDGSVASNGTSLRKVTHTYSTAGTYTVTLTVTDTGGQQRTKSLTLVFKKL